MYDNVVVEEEEEDKDDDNDDGWDFQGTSEEDRDAQVDQVDDCNNNNIIINNNNNNNINNNSSSSSNNNNTTKNNNRNSNSNLGQGTGVNSERVGHVLDYDNNGQVARKIFQGHEKDIRMDDHMGNTQEDDIFGGFEGFDDDEMAGGEQVSEK